MARQGSIAARTLTVTSYVSAIRARFDEWRDVAGSQYISGLICRQSNCRSPGVSTTLSLMVSWLKTAVALSILILLGCGEPAGEAGALVAVSEVPQITIFGADPGDHLAAAVTGDFNGDGQLDVAAASSLGDGPGNDRADAGEVYVFAGPFSEGDSVDARDHGSYLSVIYGAIPGGVLGRSLSAGDYNADGVHDIAVGAPLGNEAVALTELPGTVYVVYGRADLPEQIDLAAGDADVIITGSDPGDGVGLFLTTADLDGSPGDDLVIGAHRADGPENSRPDAGEVYMLSGASLASVMTVPADATATITGAVEGDHLSESMAPGDFDGDGRQDLALVSTFADVGSEEDSGRAYILTGPLQHDVDLATERAMMTISGVDAGDQIGHSLAPADWSLNGSDDLWLGSVSADGPMNTEDLAGEVFLFVLDEGAGQDLDPADSEALVYGAGPKARLGRNAAAGEFDSDPGVDAVFSAPDVAQRRGELYFFGAGQRPAARASEASLIIRGNDPDDILGHESFGIPSMTAVDFDRDDRAELLVAAPNGDGPDEGRLDCGEVLVLYLGDITE